MFTEMSDDTVKTRGWLLYDGDCVLCTGMARRMAPALSRQGVGIAPLQASWVHRRLNMDLATAIQEVRWLDENGASSEGADAWLKAFRAVWWLWPLYIAFRWSLTKPVLRAGYRLFSRHRTCLGTCRTGQPGTHGLLPWLPLAVLVVSTLPLQAWLPAWLFMWALAGAFFLGFKCLTLLHHFAKPASAARVLSYLFLWPGMDASAFLDRDAHVKPPRTSAWLLGAFKTLLGAALFWFVSRHAFAWHPLAGGWTGMVGAIFLLHFGLFHLVALIWQRAGVRTVPIMAAPARATSLSDFWSQRWNAAMRDGLHATVFLPAMRRFGRAGAVLLVFGLSGLIHDLVISLPAGAGYGLPTAYFLVQGLGVLLERSAAGRALGLQSGWRGRLFMAALTAGPLFFLFHPDFVTRVFVPFMRAACAI